MKKNVVVVVVAVNHIKKDFGIAINEILVLIIMVFFIIDI